MKQELIFGDFFLITGIKLQFSGWWKNNTNYGVDLKKTRDGD